MSPKIKTFLPVFFSGTAKDTYIIFTANIFTSFLAFLYTIFLARAFDPRLLGIFSAVTAFILFTSDVLDLGISASLSRFYPEIKRKRGEGNALSFAVNSFKFQLTLTIAVILLIIITSIKLALFRDKFSFMELKKLLSYSLFIALSRIFSAVSGKLDALMLIPLSSAFDAGIYSAAYKIAFTYILLAGSFSTVIETAGQ